MALRRRSERTSSMIWPGFVDAMTALLLVLMFVLSIFMIVQFVLREELTGKDRSIAGLTAELGLLTDQLFSAETERDAVRAELTSLSQLLEEERARALSLSEELRESEVAGERLSAELAARVAELAAATTALEARDARVGELEAIAQALRDERAADAARLAAAEAVTAERDALQGQVAEIRARLAAAEEERAASELTLQEKIAALELALDKKREEAEETLLLLAAADKKREELDAEAIARAEALSRQERLAAFAQAALAGERGASERGRRAVALLNAQVRRLRDQLAGLQSQLDAAEAKDVENQATIESLGARLNQALAQKVGELQRYRSEFFGRLREILGDRDDIRVVGDRFVFQSEVLFDSGSAVLGEAGKTELAKFARVLREIGPKIPGEISWLLRIDGHTDRVPIFTQEFANNWELSQARALSVVTFLIDEEGIPANRLVAAGFGEHQPIDPGSLAPNRRIELKLTER